MKKRDYMTYTLIQYKYEHGVYTIKDMIDFVDKGIITEEEFHSITRLYYDGVKFNLEKKEGKKNG